MQERYQSRSRQGSAQPPACPHSVNASARQHMTPVLRDYLFVLTHLLLVGPRCRCAASITHRTCELLSALQLHAFLPSCCQPRGTLCSMAVWNCTGGRIFSRPSIVAVYETEGIRAMHVSHDVAGQLVGGVSGGCGEIRMVRSNHAPAVASRGWSARPSGMCLQTVQVQA